MGAEPISPEVMEHRLVEAFILKVTLPLLLDTGGPQAEVLGTATLFRIDGRVFVVTAAHVLLTDPYDPSSPQIDLEKIAFPSQLRGAWLHTLGEMEVLRPKPPSHVDVALLELKSAEVIELLEQGWGFLGLEQVGPPAPGDRFMVGGYPEEYARPVGNSILQSFLSVATDPLHYVPLVKHPQPLLDLFFHLEDEGEQVGGGRREIPSLKGMSGASIWAYAPPSAGSAWTAAKALKVYAVQSSARRGAWFRGVDWGAVIVLLKDPSLGLRHPLLEDPVPETAPDADNP